MLAKIPSAYMAGLKRCYKEHLKKDASARGKVTLNLTVNETGRTVKGAAHGFAREVDDCITGQMASWRFPMPKDTDGEATEACFAITLQLVPVRAMPNTPALVGAGATAVAAGKHACDADLATARALVSIAAGIDAETLEAAVPDGVRVVRNGNQADSTRDVRSVLAAPCVVNHALVRGRGDRARAVRYRRGRDRWHRRRRHSRP